jgi:hypothetical protein
MIRNYGKAHVVTLGKDDVNEEVKTDENIVIESDLKPKEVPPNKLHSINLKKISSYRKLRRSYKISNQKAVFINDLKVVLNEFDPKEHTYNDELLLCVVNIAEHFFVFGNKEERESVKRESIREVMLPYFRNDKELLEKTIMHIWHLVKKSNAFKRSIQRLKLFFFQRS